MKHWDLRALIAKYADKAHYIQYLRVFQITFLIIGVVNTFLYNYMINQVFIVGRLGAIFFVVAGMLLLHILDRMLHTCENKTNNSFFLGLKQNIRVKILNNQYNAQAFDNKEHSVGEQKNIMVDDTDLLSEYIKTKVVLLPISFLSIFIYLVIMFVHNSFLTVVCLLILPLSYFAVNTIGKIVQQKANSFRSEYGAYEGFLMQALSHWKEIKAFNLQRYNLFEFDRRWTKLKKLRMSDELLKFVANLIVSFNQLVVTILQLSHTPQSVHSPPGN